MKQDVIAVRGARVNNLKNVNIDIPKNKLVIMTRFIGKWERHLLRLIQSMQKVRDVM